MSAGLWAVIGLVLILAEFAVPQFVVFFFGLGALLNSLLVALIPGLQPRIPLQIALWAVTSGVSLAFLRRYAARWFRGDDLKPGTEGDDATGQTAIVTDPITPDHPGRIRFRGTTWEARSFDETIAEGTTVTILQQESLAYIVTAGDLLEEDS
ncbi:MAG TPA: NfeD family protein [Alkalispirochaeta sp.]|nr:NfeD family protein [Alkalispirochaeta sp.]